MTQQEFQELLPAYALDALTSDEAQQMAAYLAVHPEHEAELSLWQNTVAALAWTAEPRQPPADLITRIKPSLSHSTWATLPAVRKAQPLAASLAAPPAPQKSARRPPPVRWPFVLCLALLLALLGLGWAYGRLREENRALREQLHTSQTEHAQNLIWQQDLLGPDGRGISLSGTAQAPQARARLAYSSHSGQAYFDVRFLPPAPRGRKYQCWFIAHGQPIAGETFNTNPQGATRLKFRVPHNGLTADVFSVTLEPDDGANQPSGPPYFSNPLS